MVFFPSKVGKYRETTHADADGRRDSSWMEASIAAFGIAPSVPSPSRHASAFVQRRARELRRIATSERLADCGTAHRTRLGGSTSARRADTLVLAEIPAFSRDEDGHARCDLAKRRAARR